MLIWLVVGDMVIVLIDGFILMCFGGIRVGMVFDLYFDFVIFLMLGFSG